MYKLNTFIFYIIFGIINSVSAQFKFEKSVFGNGAGNISNNTYKIKGTLGQALIGNSADQTYTGHFGFWYLERTITGLEEIENLIPKKFELYQNYPNPFNPTTTIRYAVPKLSDVKLEVYNILGQRLATLINEQKNPGYYEIILDASDIASGFYIYHIKAGDFIETKKMLLIK